TLRRSFRALARLGQLDDLTVLLRHGSRHVRSAVVHALFNFGRPSQVSALEPLRSDADVDIRVQVGEAIDHIRTASAVPDVHSIEEGSLDETEHLIARLLLGRVSSRDTADVTRLLFNESRALRPLARKALTHAHESRSDVLRMSEQLLTSGQPL